MAPKPRPQYRQIANDLREDINTGRLARGEAIPTERELADQYGVSPEIINRAVRILRMEGAVRVERGRGVFVHHIPPIERGSIERYSRAAREAGGARGAFATEIKRLGFEPRSDLVVTGRTFDVPENVAKLLELADGDEAVIRDRRMYADDWPVQIATSYLPVSIAGGTVIEQADTGVGGTYSRLADLGHVVERFHERIRVRAASEDEADALKLDGDQPLYEVLHTALSFGMPVEVCVHLLPVHQWILNFEWDAEQD